MQFRAIVQRNNKTATGIPVPAEVMTGLGTSKRPAVRVTINGYTYRTSVGSVDGRSMLPLSAEHRQGAGIAAGDEVDVEIALDTEPRTVTVPPDFAAALDQDGDAREVFDGLAYSHQQRFVLSILEARTAETRQRRIANALTTLHEGRTQP
jgi:bacteriocin resistance YdeI/OmpD-like protein/uncharacterized protein DUF1905